MKIHSRSIPYALAMITFLAVGCRSGTKEQASEDFHTSGSKEADQRAEQRVTTQQQIQGESEGGSSKEKNAHPTLYERLGADAGVKKIVDDFVDRSLADPRVNWERKGIQHGGLLGKSHSSEWTATPEKLEALKLHIAQFVAVATGGPTLYQGERITEVHQGMKITNAEFDASIGDLKATLDMLKVGTQEQKELLSVFESVRPQTVEKR